MPKAEKNSFDDFILLAVIALIVVIVIFIITGMYSMYNEKENPTEIFESYSLAIITVAALIFSIVFSYKGLEQNDKLIKQNEKNLEQMKNTIFIEKKIEYLIKLNGLLYLYVESDKEVITLFEKIPTKTYASTSEMINEQKEITKRMESNLENIKELNLTFIKYGPFTDDSILTACIELVQTMDKSLKWLSSCQKKCIDENQKIMADLENSYSLGIEVSEQELIKRRKLSYNVFLTESEQIKSNLDSDLKNALSVIKESIQIKG